MSNNLFNLSPRSSKARDTSLIKKSKRKPRPQTAEIKIKGGGGLLNRVQTIVATVNTKLGKYKDKYIIIRDEQELIDYIDASIENGIIAIDTETTSLNPMTCTIAGICIFTPGKKGAYIPINHVSYVTQIKTKNQLPLDIITREFQRVADAEIDIDMFNADYDTRVMKHQADVELKCTWDAYIAARLLNENEPQNGLKALHQKYCLGGKGDAFSFGSLFKGIPFTLIPINTGYLYAARDPEITYELAEFQRPFLTASNPMCEKKGLLGVAKLFHEIEMKVQPVVARMEDTGIAFDSEFALELHHKYTELMEKEKTRFNELCTKLYGADIEEYKSTMGAACKLETPISVSSPAQVAILIYDIMQLKNTVPKTSARGTGEEILSKMDNSICKTVLAYRGYSKLLSTYIDKMPNEVNPNTGRIHARFNQSGTDTGRFSSQDPNMQNIPSHNLDIRKMFTATDGYYLLSSDYSAQEPRITAHMCKDEKMIQAYKDGKDLYAEVAGIAFDVPYEECLEFRPDGTKSYEGKERRSQAKAIVLGVCYSKGVPAIAEDLGIPTKKAQAVYDKIMLSFPGLKDFMIESENMARTLGFVDTVWGRKRRLPDMQLPKYEFEYMGGVSASFDPLADEIEEDFEVDEQSIIKYTKMLDGAKYHGQKQQIIEQIKADNVKVKDNSYKIITASRKCVNSRIQGSAADQTKLAMILVDGDKEINDLGFRLVLPVHDELIGECPRENVNKVAKRLAELMVLAAKDLCVPSKCDVEVTDRWYGNVIELED